VLDLDSDGIQVDDGIDVIQRPVIKQPVPFAMPFASLAVYLCSPLASATNGAALRVDGGVVRSCF